MSGLKIVIPTSFTDTTLPILRDDRILTDGSVLLIEPGHPANKVTGPVTSGMSLPNIAAKEFAELPGGVSATASVLNIGAGLTGSKGKIELTAKGGIHGIVTASALSTNGTEGAATNASSPVAAYMLANKSHRFYLSEWHYNTRPGSADDHVWWHVTQGSNSNMLTHLRRNTGWQQSGPGGIVTSAVEPSVAAAGAVRASAETAANAALYSANPLIGWEWGKMQSRYNNAIPGWTTNFPSFVGYRYYIEDLTVSGRSYAQVDAIDKELFTQHMVTAGGRYVGDSWTSPTTIP